MASVRTSPATREESASERVCCKSVGTGGETDEAKGETGKSHAVHANAARDEGFGGVVEGCGLRVVRSGLCVQGCGFRVVGSGLWVQGCGFRVVGSGLWVLGWERANDH
jgi:hypothetical protein